MATAYTAQDALGIYLSGLETADAAGDHDAALGGSRQATEVLDMSFKVLVPYSNVFVEQAAGDAAGIGYIRATAAGSLAYTAPGDTEGAAVAIANGETKVLVSGGSVNRWVRVRRDTAVSFPLDSLSPGMRLRLQRTKNNVVGHDDVSSAERTAGLDSYRAVFLYNHSDAEVSNVKAWLVSGGNLRIGWEAPDATDGTIQTIANDTTAPAGIAWNTGTTSETGLTLTSLAPGAAYGLWIHRQLAALTAATPEASNGIWLQYDYAGITYQRVIYGLYAIADNSLIMWKHYVGEDATAPDFTSAPAATSAVDTPYGLALTPPVSGTKTYRVVTREQNAYGIESQNIFERTYTIDSAGNLLNSPLTSPEEVELTVLPGGYVLITGAYYGPRDTDPADTWQLFITTNGSDPVRGVTVPVEIDMSGSDGTADYFASRGMWGSPAWGLRYKAGPYAWDTDFRVIVGVKRSSDDERDTGATVYQATVTTVDPVPVNQRQLFQGDARAIQQGQYIDTTITVDAPNNVYLRMLPGESQFWAGSVLIWRCLWEDEERATLHIPEAWALVNDESALGAGTDGIEVVTGPPLVVWITIGGARRVKIDVTNLTITAHTFDFSGASETDCPVAIPYVPRTAELLFMAWALERGRFLAFGSGDTGGVLSMVPGVVQRRG
jgi:hypothetical protein